MLRILRTVTEYQSASDRRELARLLSGVAAGKHEALAALYRRTKAAVYGMALSYLHNAHDAQDLTQDVFVRVWDCAARAAKRPSATQNGTPFPPEKRGCLPMKLSFCSRPWQGLPRRNGVWYCSMRRARSGQTRPPFSVRLLFGGNGLTGRRAATIIK